MSNRTERAKEILEVAESLARRRGYNGFGLQFDGSSIEHAQRIVANLQGALLIARSLRSSEVFDSTASALVASYRANPSR